MKRQTDDTSPMRYVYWALIAAALLVGNYFYFAQHSATNNESINNYRSPVDPLAEYRNPAVAGIFYPQNNAAKREAKILLLPHNRRIDSTDALKAVLPRQPNESRTLILLLPSHDAEFDGAALTAEDKWLKKWPVNQDIYKKLARQKLFARNRAAYLKEQNWIKEWLPQSLPQPELKVAPIIYGRINPQDLAESLRPYLQREDTLLLVAADLARYNNFEAPQTEDAHSSCGDVGINAALILAHTMRLHPELLPLINTNGNAAAADAGSPSVLAAETESLRQFAADYRTDLLKIADAAWQNARQHKKYSPSRSEYAEELFNRGATFVRLSQNGAETESLGSVYPRRSVAADVAANVFAAATTVDFDPEQPVDIEISLLSGYEEIAYSDEADLLNKLQAGTDGVVIRDGNRQGLFLPAMWRQFPDKSLFWQNLKIKAGMNPAYWSDKIKVYRFHTIEVKNEN